MWWVTLEQTGAVRLQGFNRDDENHVVSVESVGGWKDLLTQSKAKVSALEDPERFTPLKLSPGFTLALAFPPDQPYFGLLLHHSRREVMERVYLQVAAWPMVWQWGQASAALEKPPSTAEDDPCLQATQWLEACSSRQIRALVEQAKRVAKTETGVLITGETGTGKGVLSKALHAWSNRSASSFVSVNCATLKPELIESELFGHVAGAFTGADQDRAGRFQMAHGGTLFLDEIGELPQALQAKLLRVLQEGQFEPLGSNRTVQVDVRLIAATNRNIEDAVRQGVFREDLYYRLAVFPLHMPPLRERLADFPVIVGDLFGTWVREGLFDWQPELDRADWESLKSGAWPGNIRELSNFLKRAMVLAGGPDHWHTPIVAKHRLSRRTKDQLPDLPTMQTIERSHIIAALKTTQGRLYGPGGAAKLLGLHPSTLRGRMRKLGLGGAKQFKPKPD